MESVVYIAGLGIVIIIMNHIQFSALFDMVKANEARLEYICQKLIDLEASVDRLDEDLYEDDEDDWEEEEK